MKKNPIGIIFIIFSIMKLFAGGEREVLFNDDNFKGPIIELHGDSLYNGKFHYLENGIIEIKKDDQTLYSTFYSEKHNNNIKSEIVNKNFIWLLYSPKDYYFNENILTINGLLSNVKLFFDPVSHRLTELHRMSNKIDSKTQITKYQYTNEGFLDSVVEIVDDKQIYVSNYFYDGIYRDNIQRPYIIEIPGRNYPYTVFRPIPSICIFDDKKRERYTVSVSRISGDHATYTLQENEVIFYKTIIEYDEFGNVMRYSIDYSGTLKANNQLLHNYVIEYEFDNNCNWIKAEVFELLENNEKKSVHIGKRKILY